MKGLQTDLAERISGADKREPYVWRLKLSEEEFNNLESAITQNIVDNGGRHTQLISAETAWFIMVYLAEWYKRCYYQGEQNSGRKAINPESSELKRLWELSGIDINTFVYTNAKGDRLWQYSIYVLGGLAIKHELAGKKNASFFKQLCRLLHQENGILEADEFNEENRAISFRESILRKHSLHGYLTEIINDRPPFSHQDLQNPASQINLFIKAIKEADSAVISNKFDFEWVVRHTPENETMDRWLQVNLRPELYGGLHEELHIRRYSKWGIQNPERLKLSFFIRFLDGGNCIATSAPFTSFWSSGDDEHRLIKWGSGTPKVKDIPTTHFDSIEIIAEDIGTNTRYENIQKEPVGDFMQLWRIDDFKDEWSNKNRSQKDTAVLFSEAYTLPEISSDAIIRKPFRGKDGSRTPALNWYYINESATLVNEQGDKFTLYNRQGYDHLRIRTYNNIIRYLDGGLVACTFLNEDEIEETQNLPLVFHQNDIRAIHYETRDAELPDADTNPKLVQFKPLKASRYEDWTEQNQPPFGPLNIKAQIKGKDFKMAVFHLPGFSVESPIERDYAGSTIRYAQFRNGKIECKEFRDEILLNKEKPLEATLSMHIQASENAYAEIEVYRPTLVKELLVDGKVLRYIQDGEELNLPYILKHRSSINDFNQDWGYRRYNCSSLSSIYRQIENPRLNWQEGTVFSATQFDPHAPAWLNLIFGNPEMLNQAGRNIYYWDYRQDSDPKQDIPSMEEMKKKTSLLFESLVNPDEELSFKFPFAPQNPFSYSANAVSMLKCFETAMKHETYFFIFWPLLNRLKKEEYVDKIYQPFFESRNGNLTEKDKAGLRRFAEEFNFDWKKIGITL